MSGQWIALDVYFFSKPFPLRLRDRFGAAGQMVFIAFLCACKQNRPQGEITFASDCEALQKMSVEGWPLVDDQGEKWTLEEFWSFTGRMKQTKKTARGRVWNVKSTQFERWQRTIDRDLAAERQRRSRARKQRDHLRDSHCDNRRDATVTDIDSDIDTPLPPNGGNGIALRAEDQNPQDLRAAANAIRGILANTQGNDTGSSWASTMNPPTKTSGSPKSPATSNPPPGPSSPPSGSGSSTKPSNSTNTNPPKEPR